MDSAFDLVNHLQKNAVKERRRFGKMVRDNAHNPDRHEQRYIDKAEQSAEKWEAWLAQVVKWMETDKAKKEAGN